MTFDSLRSDGFFALEFSETVELLFQGAPNKVQAGRFRAVGFVTGYEGVSQAYQYMFGRAILDLAGHGDQCLAVVGRGAVLVRPGANQQ